MLQFLMRDKKGFNMMELVVVIAIIGISAALVAPNISAWVAKQQLNSEARNIAASFSMARNQAIRGGGEDVRLSFDVANGWYSAHANSAGTVVPRTVLPNGVSISNITFAQNSTGYNNRGAALNIGSVTIRSSKIGSANNFKTITLSLGGGVSITP